MIVNRAGSDTLSGGKGDDLFVLKESAGVCTENLIRVDDVVESPKLAE